MKKKLLYALVIGMLVAVSGFLYVNETDRTEIVLEPEEEEVSGQKDQVYVSPMIVVHVSGAVVSPGVYEVAEHSRLHEVIDVAGGFEEGANQDYLNLARFVFDGEKIQVPRVGADASNNQVSGQPATHKVSINQGDLEALMTLTGIGEAKAAAIIRYRTENGPFQRLEDIMKVNGIKDAMFEKIKEEIVI